MLDIPEKMKAFVNDYKMKLLEARENKLTLHNLNNKDFFHLLNVMLNKSISRNEAKARVIQYSRGIYENIWKANSIIEILGKYLIRSNRSKNLKNMNFSLDMEKRV